MNYKKILKRTIGTILLLQIIPLFIMAIVYLDGKTGQFGYLIPYLSGLIIDAAAIILIAFGALIYWCFNDQVMDKLFIKYKIALELKEKGFDEPCFGYYENQSKKLIINYTNQPSNHPEAEKRPSMFITDNRNSVIPQWSTSAPTHQQVCDWLRENHNIHLVPINCGTNAVVLGYIWFIQVGMKQDAPNTKKGTYYESLNNAIEESLKLI